MSEKRQQELRQLFQQTRLPLMAAPMFLVTGPEIVVAAAQAGIIGVYPAPNARNLDDLEAVLAQIAEGAAGAPAPWGMNMIVHSSYDRFDAELELLLKYQPKLVSTALGSPKRVVEHVHGYGGMVVADVISPKLARKAADAGVDALILVTNGAGGHTGTYHPFAFLQEVRKFWDGPVGLAGAISTGTDVRAAQLAGADFAVAGTRFIPTPESRASEEYRQLLVDSDIEDLVLSKAVSGVLANWLKPTLEQAGFTEEQLKQEGKVDFSGDISTAPKAWKHVWSAGHGLGGIDAVRSVADTVEHLRQEYLACLHREREDVEATLARMEDLQGQPQRSAG